MRVQIIVTNKSRKQCVNRPLAAMLVEGLSRAEGVALTDKGPDIVHVFGLWDMPTANAVTSICKRKIPLVYTSLCGLEDSVDVLQGGATVACRMARGKIIRQASVVHVSGAMEERALKRSYTQTNTCTIANPYVTSMLSADDALELMLRLYGDTIQSHDAAMRAAIDARVRRATTDEALSSLCSQFLYVQYMLHRGGIAKSLLDGLAAQLTATQYDEDAFAQAVKQLGFSSFARSLLSALSRTSALTEGFMPFDPMDDKLCAKIINNIIND